MSAISNSPTWAAPGKASKPALGLPKATVRSTTGQAGSCVSQGAPLIIPDVITILPGEEAGFPNGRKLDDQAIDLTLAVILLDLSAEALTTFADMPLNPDRNDKGVEGAFLTTFPYLHPPHQP